ncbi:hypothetical protein ATE49_15365 [Elizabethkingia miricola]|uniref:Uncharacterized protein n=1 Tax=Elizabethkingia miricola TaxID=172045 RepID=A0ABY3NAD5_ELIMR|nr:hypothetical protein [Elizabethkingia miricola]OBS12813.1 hypothetical protein ATE49_15365 [Elizabethkingia miricola]TYO83760.1 hypothetical protein LX74_04052 [Elizabethkingia miricola]
MGVDYSANKGIGFMVNHNEFEDNEDFDIREYLEEVLRGTGYQYFEVGEGAYTGETNEVYVVLSDFKPIQDLEERAQKLKDFLLQLHLVSEDSEYDLVGGLEVY